jgi:hypothetical protein
MIIINSKELADENCGTSGACTNRKRNSIYQR